MQFYPPLGRRPFTLFSVWSNKAAECSGVLTDGPLYGGFHPWRGGFFVTIWQRRDVASCRSRRVVEVGLILLCCGMIHDVIARVGSMLLVIDFSTRHSKHVDPLEAFTTELINIGVDEPEPQAGRSRLRTRSVLLLALPHPSSSLLVPPCPSLHIPPRRAAPPLHPPRRHPSPRPSAAPPLPIPRPAPAFAPRSAAPSSAQYRR